MMYEADTTNKGYINESDFMYIIAKQKIDYRTKLVNEASNKKEILILFNYIIFYLI